MNSCVLLSLKPLSAQEHKSRDSTSDARGLFIWHIFHCENREMMQCWKWKLTVESVHRQQICCGCWYTAMWLVIKAQRFLLVVRCDTGALIKGEHRKKDHTWAVSHFVHGQSDELHVSLCCCRSQEPFTEGWKLTNPELHQVRKHQSWLGVEV